LYILSLNNKGNCVLNSPLFHAYSIIQDELLVPFCLCNIMCIILPYYVMYVTSQFLNKLTGCQFLLPWNTLDRHSLVANFSFLKLFVVSIAFLSLSQMKNNIFGRALIFHIECSDENIYGVSRRNLYRDSTIKLSFTLTYIFVVIG
jgi:hypothetical protein